MNNSPLRIAVFASGSGSNLEAILQAIESGFLQNVEVTAVVSNKASARALTRAEARKIPTAVLTPGNFPDESAYLQALTSFLDANDVNFIALAGYMKKIPGAIVKAYRERMLNIHPSLLPAFGGAGMYGIKIHQAAIRTGVRWSGVTVHFVDEEYDTGPIFLQKPVPVHDADTPEDLAKRILKAEHHIYPEALRLFAEGRVHIDGRNVTIDTRINHTPSNQ